MIWKFRRNILPLQLDVREITRLEFKTIWWCYNQDCQLSQETKQLSVLDKHTASLLTVTSTAVTCMHPMSNKVIFFFIFCWIFFSYTMNNWRSLYLRKITIPYLHITSYQAENPKSYKPGKFQVVCKQPGDSGKKDSFTLYQLKWWCNFYNSVSYWIICNYSQRGLVKNILVGTFPYEVTFNNHLETISCKN